MGLKEMIKKTFSDDKKITLERYRGAKFAFILSSFLFFINFYFVGANFYIDIFSHTLGFIYIILLLSLVFYVYFGIKKLLIGRVSNYFLIVILIILLLIFGFFILPFIIKGGINGVLDIIKLYS